MNLEVDESEIEKLRAAYEERVRLLNVAVGKHEGALAILGQVAARVHGEEDVQRILDIALEEILTRLGLSAAWVFMGDEKERKLHLAASKGVAAAYLEGIRSAGLEECLCPEVFWTGHRMQARNTTQCPRMPTIVEGLSEPVAHACIPLRFEGQSRGVLNVAARPGELFSDDELQFLETVGHQVCIAVERAGHLRAERLRNQEARAMATINKAIGGSLDAAAVLRAVGETAGQILGADQVYVLLGSDPRRMRVGHVSGSPHADLHEGHVADLEAMGWKLSLKALAERGVVRMDDRDSDGHVNRGAARLLDVASAIVTPLLAHDQLLGVLVLARTAPHRWTDDQVDVAEALAAQAALALENARLYGDARKAFEAERLRNQEARALAAINKAIGGALDVEAVLSAVGRTALEVLEADRIQVFLGSDPRKIDVAHLSGLPHPELKEHQPLDLVAANAFAQRRALEERLVFRVDDWATDPRVNQELARRWGMGSAIVVPLAARELTLGLLVVTRTEARPWTEEQLDVTEALAAQASVALENARLYEDARQAYQDLKAAQQRILQAEKMAVLGTFASGLAHEVRNPLNSIALQLSILERRIGRMEPELSGTLQELIGIIREEIKRLDALVGDFLLFSRTNRIQYRLESLEALADEITRLLRPEARESGVTLRRQRLGEPIPSLRMDAEKMKQVLINLVRNAIEAMPEGGVVVVESGVEDEAAHVVVRDTGPGLPDDLDIFQLFVTTKPKGTGLGLSIAQQIVLEHGGEIAARSEPGKGAAFTVSLPLIPAEESAVRGEVS